MAVRGFSESLLSSRRGSFRGLAEERLVSRHQDASRLAGEQAPKVCVVPLRLRSAGLLSEPGTEDLLNLTMETWRHLSIQTLRQQSGRIPTLV